MMSLRPTASCCASLGTALTTASKKGHFSWWHDVPPVKAPVLWLASGDSLSYLFSYIYIHKYIYIHVYIYMFIWYFIEIAKTSRDSDRSYDLRHSSVVERPASVSFLHSMRRGRFILYIYIYINVVAWSENMSLSLLKSGHQPQPLGKLPK